MQFGSLHHERLAIEQKCPLSGLELAGLQRRSYQPRHYRYQQIFYYFHD